MAPGVMVHNDVGTNHKDTLSKSIDFDIVVPSVLVTKKREPFVQAEGEARLMQAGVARANIAASAEVPHGTKKGGWNKKFRDETVLQQHVAFFDRDRDGVIWPQDTYNGFRRLGYNNLLSFVALVIIHSGFSYLTLPAGYWLPDPFFRIYTARIHKAKHGSDTGTYDNEGRFIPQKFEDMFAKYSINDEMDDCKKDSPKNGLTLKNALSVMSGQRLPFDPFGWFAAVFEWIATYILLWPEDGQMKKEDLRRVYDGSLFYEIAARREIQKSKYKEN